MSRAIELVTYARQLCSEGSYARSYDLYLKAFDSNPQLNQTYEEEFITTVLKLNESLVEGKKTDHVFTNFAKAVHLFPNNFYLLNEIGKYLCKFELYDEAWGQFQKALKINPGFVSAEKNLNSVKNLMVERWHFRMLNDKIRNENYRLALHEVITPKYEVILDLGAGSGLLSMYATERNPKAITACDSSEVMTVLMDCVLRENNLLKSIAVVNKVSTAMDYINIKDKRTLLITEVFDAGLFGEHILQSLTHAWEYLLRYNAKVVPHKAEFFVLGAESEMLNAKYHLHPKAKNLLNIPNHNVHVLSNDTYDAEDIHYYKDLKYITESQSVITVDFNNIDDIRDKLHHSEPLNVELKAMQNGDINVVIGWFNLYLTDNITITTDPRCENRANAWQQAVFFDHVTKSVKENEMIDLHFLINSGKLTMLSNSNNTVMKISSETLKFLNDTKYVESIKSCVGMASIYLGQIMGVSQLDLLDLSPFPLFGLLMLKRGIKTLQCYAKTESDKEFIEEVLKANGIEISRVNYLIGNDWTEDSFLVDKYHAIFYNMIDVCGDIDLRAKDMGQYLRDFHLIERGLFLPTNVTLTAQIVNSNWLEINNIVHDENVTNYKIAQHINKYQVSQNFCLDYAHLDYTALSEPVELGKCVDLHSSVVNVPIICDGEANAIICWYNIEVLDYLEWVSTKRPSSYIEGTAFLVNPKLSMVQGDTANILLCIDPDGTFKLLLDLEGR